MQSRLGAVVLVAPGVIWLTAFFLVPLAIIFVFSLGTKDAGGHVLLNHLGLQNYIQATRPERSESTRLNSSHPVLSRMPSSA